MSQPPVPPGSGSRPADPPVPNISQLAQSRKNMRVVAIRYFNLLREVDDAAEAILDSSYVVIPEALLARIRLATRRPAKQIRKNWHEWVAEADARSGSR